MEGEGAEVNLRYVDDIILTIWSNIMNQINLKDETAKLRSKAPLTSSSMRSIAIAAVAVGVFFTVAHLFVKPQPGEPEWIFLAFLISIELLLACTAFWFYRRIKRFINQGVVIFANVASTHWFPQNAYRINLEYEFEGKWFKKAINGPRWLANHLESLSAILVVVDPNRPVDAELLSSFATSTKEKQSIMLGQSGLARQESYKDVCE